MQAFHAQFLSHFKGGMMKPNRYVVEFHLPPGVSSSEERRLNGGGGINIKCHTAMFPQRTLQTSELKQNTNPYRVPFGVMYDPVTFSFYSDASGDTRSYFDMWQQAAIHLTSHTLNFYKEYVSDISMWILDEAGRKRYGVKLIEAYPISVGAMDVSYSQANNFQTVICTMSYKRWEEIDLEDRWGIVGPIQNI